jgi:hypothetical protein
MAIWQDLVDTCGFTGSYQSVQQLRPARRHGNSPDASAVIETARRQDQRWSTGDSANLKFMASTLKLPRQNQPGDLCPRAQQVSSVAVPIAPTSGDLFHHILRHRPASASRQNCEVFVIF